MFLKMLGLIFVLLTCSQSILAMPCEDILDGPRFDGPRKGKHILLRHIEHGLGSLRTAVATSVLSDGTIQLSKSYAPSWDYVHLYGYTNLINLNSKNFIGYEVSEYELEDGSLVRPNDFVVVRINEGTQNKYIKIGRIFSNGTFWLAELWAPGWNWVNLYGETPFVHASSRDLVRVVRAED